MNKKFFVLALFMIMVLAQLYVPAKMIFDREGVLAMGKDFKFKSAPIDPTDPFRGKYITLNYEAIEYPVEDISEWVNGEYVYVHLKTDADGYAAIVDLSKEKPEDSVDYVKARVNYVSEYNQKKIVLSYPFDRFYMEESKAYDAELAYRESLQDTSQVTYALISVKDGEAVIKDVMIDGVSIQSVVSAKRK